MPLCYSADQGQVPVGGYTPGAGEGAASSSACSPAGLRAGPAPLLPPLRHALPGRGVRLSGGVRRASITYDVCAVLGPRSCGALLDVRSTCCLGAGSGSLEVPGMHMCVVFVGSLIKPHRIQTLYRCLVGITLRPLLRALIPE